MGTITITLNPPLGRGRFEARLGDRVIVKSSRQPLLDAARVLLAEGMSPDTRIAMRHAGADHDALSSTVGKAAGLTVEELTSDGMPRLRKWRPFEGRPGAAAASPVRPNGDGPPD